MQHKRLIILAASLFLYSCHTAAPSKTPKATELKITKCDLPAGKVLVKHGEDQLVMWQLVEQAHWRKEILPKSPALTRFRQAIIDAKQNLKAPLHDPPDTSTPRLASIWAREFENRDLAQSGRAGEVRPIQCLEAMFYAKQAERYDPLKQPTEFIVAQTSKMQGNQRMVRLYFGAGAKTFPSKRVYPFDQVKQDVAQGWQFDLMLHNHTPVRYQGQPALGEPAPSTNDVQFSRALAKEMGLKRILVTNGFYTADIPTKMLDQYKGPLPREIIKKHAL